MTLARRTLLVAAVAFAATAAVAQTATAPKQKFTMAAFEAAQAAGKPVLVDVTAPWCPSCKAQAPIINSLLAKPVFKGIAVFEVDFDSQKDVVRMLKATTQSTLIVFKGKQEAGRSTGDTNADSIASLLGKSI